MVFNKNAIKRKWNGRDRTPEKSKMEKEYESVRITINNAILIKEVPERIKALERGEKIKLADCQLEKLTYTQRMNYIYGGRSN